MIRLDYKIMHLLSLAFMILSIITIITNLLEVLIMGLKMMDIQIIMIIWKKQLMNNLKELVIKLPWIVKCLNLKKLWRIKKTKIKKKLINQIFMRDSSNNFLFMNFLTVITYSLTRLYKMILMIRDSLIMITIS